jgi:hypothetical protein
MPIEIKELNIRVAVSGTPPPSAQRVQGGKPGQEGHEAHGVGRDEIVADCVEQVFQLLQARKER